MTKSNNRTSEVSVPGASVASGGTPTECDGAGARLPEIEAFAWVMHEKIERHNRDRGPYGWRRANIPELFERLDRYVAALRDAVGFDLPMNGPLVAGKAANVANLAMMIADMAGGLPLTFTRT